MINLHDNDNTTKDSWPLRSWSSVGSRPRRCCAGSWGIAPASSWRSPYSIGSALALALVLSSTGACEINIFLDGSFVSNVLTPLPLFQSWRKDAQQQLTTNECLFHRPIALALRVFEIIDIKGDEGSPTLTASRMSVHFADTGIGKQTFETNLATDFEHAER